MKYISFFLLLSILFSCSYALAEEVSFNQQDRERIIRLETKVGEIDKRIIRLETKVGEIDKRFEQRFEQIDKRLEFMQHLMIGMLGVFGGLCGIFAGLLIWDRRTFKEKAKNEVLKEIGEKQIKPILSCLREYAKAEPKLREVLAKHHLL